MAVVFWLAGSFVLMYSQPGTLGILFFLQYQVCSAVLATGAFSAAAPLWLSRSFFVLLWWFSSLVLHFHLLFPVSVLTRKLRWLPVLGYGVAAGGSLINILLYPDEAGMKSFLYQMPARLWFGACLFAVIFLLGRAYRRAVGGEARRQVRVIVLGGGLALLPFTLLSLIPEVILAHPLLPYSITFAFLLLIPASYVYAVLHYRLLPLDLYVSRAATSVFVGTFLFFFYLTGFTLLERLTPMRTNQPTVALLLALLVASTWIPLFTYIMPSVQKFLYGGWYDYRSATQQLSRTIGQAMDELGLAQTLSQLIQKVAQLESVWILLADKEGWVTLVAVASDSAADRQLEGLRFTTTDSLWQYFESHPITATRNTVAKALSPEHLSEESSRLLLSDQANSWLPLRGRERLTGLLILGKRRGGETIRNEDLEGLVVAARQAGLAFENAALVAELEQRALEMKRLHSQSLSAREEERKRLSRDLHDHIIQALVGLNYQLPALNDLCPPAQGYSTQYQQSILQIIGDLRQICAGLRPPALDSLGLVPALRSRVREAESQASFQIAFDVEGDEDAELPEAISLCIYRVLQEALLNVQKYAAARRVDVHLSIRPKEVVLTVKDDGRGFGLPAPLGQLTSAGHFGLVGLRERVEQVSGAFEIVTAPGEGTCLTARVPLNGGATSRPVTAAMKVEQ
jgi:signal transduction histidine kinase